MTKLCAVCGAIIPPLRYERKTCSPACHRALAQKRSRELNCIGMSRQAQQEAKPFDLPTAHARMQHLLALMDVPGKWLDEIPDDGQARGIERGVRQ